MPSWAWFAVLRFRTMWTRVLQNIQSDLFHHRHANIDSGRIRYQDPGIGDEEIANLEHEIDALENTLPPLRQFILPGGSSEACRTASGPHRSPSRRTPLRHAVSIRENRSPGSSLPEPAFRSFFPAGSLRQSIPECAGTASVHQDRLLVRSPLVDRPDHVIDLIL